MNWILLAVVGVALLCPISMFGPMLLERLGLRKRSGAGGMSCMGMHGPARTRDTNLDGLRTQRDALDREIARVRESADETDGSRQANDRSADRAASL